MTNDLYKDIVAWWQNKNISNDAQLAEALNGQLIAFAYNSGKIENDKITYHDTREIFEHDGVTAYTGDLRTLYEIRNAKYATEYWLNSFNQRTPIDENFVKELQKRLTLNTYDARRWQQGERPGTYKLGDYVTGREEVGALPEDVAAEMQELLADIQEVPAEKALIGAAFLHAKLENIHPFADGNGRTGRLLLNYFLVLHNHPPIIIHEEDRRAYFDALEQWDMQQELDPLLAFLKQQCIKTWQKNLERTSKAKPTSPSLKSFL